MGLLFDHGNELFFFFLFPLIGLGIDYLMTSQKSKFLLVILLVLISPILFGYFYVIDYMYQLLGILIFACIYSFLSRLIQEKTAKITLAIIISGLLFIILGIAAFMDSMSGYATIERKWNIDNYEIEQIYIQGFSGRPVKIYRLNRYGFIPIVLKHVETSIEDGSIKKCKISFKKSEITFDKCTGKITKNVL